MTVDSGRITLSDVGRVTQDNGSSHHHGITILVDYHIDPIAQLMSYTVHLNERVVRQVFDVPYNYAELNTIATEILFRNMYKGFPNLKIKVDEGEPYGKRQNS